MNPSTLAELDLAISDMDTPILENQVKTVLEGIPGIESVRLQERGALIHYRPKAVTKDRIADLISQAGFKVTVFQDSASGETHEVSY
jgi:copper chaperone CopZ